MGEKYNINTCKKMYVVNLTLLYNKVSEIRNEIIFLNVLLLFSC